jgi:hypothetical protein
MKDKKRRTPWLLWPVVALWNLITWILKVTTRLIAAILGLVLMIVGALLTVTIVGAVVGVPLIIFGFLLMLRSIF